MQFFSVGLYPTDDIQYSKDTENQIFLLTLSSLPPLCTSLPYSAIRDYIGDFDQPITSVIIERTCAESILCCTSKFDKQIEPLMRSDFIFMGPVWVSESHDTRKNA